MVVAAHFFNDRAFVVGDFVLVFLSGLATRRVFLGRSFSVLARFGRERFSQEIIFQGNFVRGRRRKIWSFISIQAFFPTSGFALHTHVTLNFSTRSDLLILALGSCVSSEKFSVDCRVATDVRRILGAKERFKRHRRVNVSRSLSLCCCHCNYRREQPKGFPRKRPY